MYKSFLTIAIPFYNGFESVKLILDELVTDKDENFEILISDDFSSEIQSDSLSNYVKKTYPLSNIRLYRNSTNLGMDMNFQKCIELSNSEYTWFLGQDDFIKKHKLLKVINLLNQYEPNVVYLNYEIKRTWNYKKEFIHTSNLAIESGDDVDQFHISTRGNLPHFLPSLIIKNSLWPDLNYLSLFYDTYFIQLGAFLKILSLHKKWLYIGEPMSIGSIPKDGWQSSIEKKVKIYSGFMKCIKTSKDILPNLKNICEYQYDKNTYQHISLTIEAKLENNESLIAILSSELIFTKKYRFITNFIKYIPNSILGLFIISRSLYFKLNQVKNILKTNS